MENEVSDLEKAKNRASSSIVEAKKFKAMIANSGNSIPMFMSGDGQNWVVNQMNDYNSSPNQDTQLICTDNQLQMGDSNQSKVLPPIQQMGGGHIPDIGSSVSDDDFFHLTCHIDPNLIHKIEKGEFIELEKLLPKGRSGEENWLEWVQCEGGTYLVPA